MTVDDRTSVEDRNWGRWGHDDECGTTNLITPDNVLAGVGTVREGMTIGLSRPLDKVAGPGNSTPVELRASTHPRSGFEGAGSARDYLGVSCHGVGMTHLDALCHVWDEHGAWNGRSPETLLGDDGVQWCSVDAWADGIVTRGLVLDVPAHRGTEHVTVDEPVTGAELAEIVAKLDPGPRPGDALLVYCGRESWVRTHGPWGAPPSGWDTARYPRPPRPGLDASVVPVLKQLDCSLLVWDMMDAYPGDEHLAWPVHRAIPWLGLPLLDNALLEPLADACRQRDRHDVLLVVAPLRLPGGTGSPVTPVAVL
ncbi:MAG: cyclase family protein [Dehalococcoidia bacterium]